jgi:hypothetical protein
VAEFRLGTDISSGDGGPKGVALVDQTAADADDVVVLIPLDNELLVVSLRLEASV